MRNELDRSSDAHWDIKQGKGGLIDIEFITQYLVLRDAPRMPALVTYSDNWRQLDALAAAGSIAAGDRETLIVSYRRYRAHVHAAALQEDRGPVPAADFVAERRPLGALWAAYLGERCYRRSCADPDRKTEMPGTAPCARLGCFNQRAGDRRSAATPGHR